MSRIIIAPAYGGTELEVDQTTYNNGYFAGYVYVRDAGPGTSTNPLGPLDVDVAGLVPASSGSSTAAALRAALGHPVSTDGTNSLPAPNGVGLEFVITATGLQDIRFNGTSL